MNEKLWKYCAEVAQLLSEENWAKNANRRVIEEIETVTACFEADRTPFGCTLVIVEREKLLPV